MSIYFTWYLIPVVIAALLVFWVVLRRQTWRLVFALVLSVAVLALLHPIFAAIALGLITVAWQIVELHRAKRLRAGRAALLIVSIAVISLAVGKYGQQGVAAVWGSDDPFVKYFLAPLGISYFIFRLMQYVFDHLRGVLTDNSWLRLAAFVMWMPTFPAGPIETYQGFYEKASCRFDRQLVYEGLRRIAMGYFKKVFVVDFVIVIFFGDILDIRDGFSAAEVNPWYPLAYCIIVFVRAYFDLSAYTDLAIGFSRLFGFRIMENFHLPFWKPNLAEFWRGWHISLSSWVRNNVYFPVFGLTRKPWLGLYASMLTMGLWHYVSLNWAFWGLWHGTGLVVVSRWERWKRARRKTRKKAGKAPRAGYEPWIAWLGYPATFMYAAFGYAMVSTESFRQGAKIMVMVVWGPLKWLAGLG